MDNDIEKVIQTLEFNYKAIEGLINHYKKEIEHMSKNLFLNHSSNDYEEMARLYNKLARLEEEKEAFDFSIHCIKSTKTWQDMESDKLLEAINE
jgi:hypothetical protein